MKNFKTVTVVGALAGLVMSLSAVGIATLATGEERPSNLRFASDENGGDRASSRSDDPAGHDAGDDKGGDRPRGTSDDPAGHDAGDDKGGERKVGSDDSPGHDAGDDHGGDRHGGSDDKNDDN